MPFGDIVLVGNLVRDPGRIGVPGLILWLFVVMIVIFIMIRFADPEIPPMGMCRFKVGTPMVLIGMGMEKQERRDGEKNISGKHQPERASAFRSRYQPMEG